jgi:small subunit ribosomal protein S15
MYLTKGIKQELFENHGRLKAKSDTGSPESQIALFTHRINHLTQHLKKNKKDYSTRLGLLKLVGKRRSLLDYLYKKEIERYRAIIAELNIRK